MQKRAKAMSVGNEKSQGISGKCGKWVGRGESVGGRTVDCNGHKSKNFQEKTWEQDNKNAYVDMYFIHCAYIHM